MDVYLVRHAQAVSKEQDPERPLSDEGRATAAGMAQCLASLGGGFIAPPLAEIWHSGKLRAQQTAEIFARALAPGRALTMRRGMKPKDDPALVYEALSDLREQPGALLLVGHLPHLTRLASLLLADDAERTPIEFAYAGVVQLRPTDRGWALGAYITPACLRKTPGLFRLTQPPLTRSADNAERACS